VKVAVLLSDTGACGTYRMLWPAQAVKSAHPDWDISVHLPGQVAFYTDRQTGQLAQVSGLPHVSELDLLVVQRVGKDALVQLMQRAQESGCAVVMDNDDAMWAIDKQNVAWGGWNNPLGHHWRVTDQAARYADLCTTTTELLAKRYNHSGRAAVVPNFVPRAAVVDTTPTYDQQRDEVIVGWSGLVATHPTDLQVVGDGLQRAAAETGCVAAAMPDHVAAERIWGLPVRHLPGAELGRAYYQALTALDVALVPLADTNFNRAKSALKALECSAVGSAVIASPTPANRALARDLPLLLAASPAEWREHIVRLVKDPAERRERGEQGRAAVLERWTFASHGQTWADVWERAVMRRRRLTPREAPVSA